MTPRIILASGSPRRRELLSALIPAFEVHPSQVPEPLTGDSVADVTTLAVRKAAAVAGESPDALVVGADTIVYDALRQYGKPGNAEAAAAMLARLQGRAHQVATGIAVVRAGRTASDVSVSEVTLARLLHPQIVDYVASGRPLDKAGGYAIQDEDVPTVAALDGCYCGVMGLPLWRLRRLLFEAGVECASPDQTFGRCAACPERSECVYPRPVSD